MKNRKISYLVRQHGNSAKISQQRNESERLGMSNEHRLVCASSSRRERPQDTIFDMLRGYSIVL